MTGTPERAMPEPAGPTLGEAIRAFRPAGPPDSETRERRQRLAEFVREVEPRVHRAPAAERETVRALLGWDDASLHRFINSTMLVHSSTHVSMNAFAPMVSFPWFCLRLLTGTAGSPDGGQGSHLRTQLTHNNLSDNRWKPHVWWRLDRRGRLARTQLFSKQPRFKHKVLLVQPVPDVPDDDLTPADAQAVRLARHATNFAYFAMMYRMSLERGVGLHIQDGTVEIPVDLMNAFSLRAGDFPRWHQTLYRQGFALRRIGEDDRLQPLSAEAAAARGPADPLRPEATLICPNYINVGHAHRMGPAAAIGADRMAAYEEEMTGVLSRFFADLGETHKPPQFLGVAGMDLDRLVPLPKTLTAELAAEGGKPSLPLYTAVYADRLVPALDTALTHPMGELASIITRHVPAPVAARQATATAHL
ncbi:hypothetical protein ABZY09_07340 [Streptomyces sp. NPDC002928]|uniref:hypothetical protein n=1 Tax=Streptomyces sp. NPDC002928 TaxID=3154440 RepID=UPI0033A34388